MSVKHQAPFDFWQLPFSKPVRQKLASIDQSRQLYPNQKMALVGKLLVCRSDLARGLHIPLSDHVRLRAKFNENFGTFPHEITADVGTPLCFFSNPLLIPEGYDRPDFDVTRALPPTLRATNAGFLIATIEHDCHSRDQFEEIVGWLAASGRFKEVDALRKYKEYCGYSAVFSGNGSVHFHFVFDTRHLSKAPFDASYEERQAHREQQSAISAQRAPAPVGSD